MKWKPSTLHIHRKSIWLASLRAGKLKKRNDVPGKMRKIFISSTTIKAQCMDIFNDVVNRLILFSTPLRYRFSFFYVLGIHIFDFFPKEILLDSFFELWLFTFAWKAIPSILFNVPNQMLYFSFCSASMIGWWERVHERDLMTAAIELVVFPPNSSIHIFVHLWEIEAIHSKLKSQKVDFNLCTVDFPFAKQKWWLIWISFASLQ